ncbi:MAG TPA: formimidoylglutamase [Gemmatales bacterium]|nr:formimidoylglutamase [Gemmatales bacterium]
MTSPDRWKGRDDTANEGTRAQRWHQQIQPWQTNSPPGITLVGFGCDEGVRRNQGRIGAASAPSTIRQALSNLAWHQTTPVYDYGDVQSQPSELEAAQQALGEQIASLLKAGQRPLIMGGGHETAWGTFQGLVAHVPQKTIGIINIDAHFDLRPSPVPHSGTPFAQMADWCQAHGRPFHYLCLGIAEAANTAALFDRATSLRANWVTDEELSLDRYTNVLSTIQTLINQVDVVYLSIDLDVLPLSIMSAVSAPAPVGVALEVVLRLVSLIAQSGKLIVSDVVEYNPQLDHDQAGARVAARILWHLARHWQPLRVSP